MPPGSRALSKTEIKKIWKGYPDVRKAVLELHERGWRIVKESKHYRAYCPCEGSPADFSVSGTPRVDGYEADKCRRNSNKCPDRHEHLQARLGRWRGPLGTR